MLILGESKVGKTSLYRQLVGKEFLEDLESTKGIDNNTVDTMVEERSVVTGNDWHENESSTGEAFAKAAGEETRQLMPPKTEKTSSNLPNRASLWKTIDKIKKQLQSESMKERTLSKPTATDVSEKPASDQHMPTERGFEYSKVSAKKPPIEEMRKEVRQTEKPTTKVVVTKEPKPKPPPVQPEARDTRNRPRSLTPPPSPESKDETDQMSINTAHEDEQEVPDQTTMAITRRDSSIIAGIAKGRVKHDTLETLTLNCFDFAGQPEYRPMHHCFISRRACYLVVFKLPDMVRFIQTGPTDDHNPWEAFRYWIHSINAHIYPPDPEEKKKMGTFRRIILVGTHREDVSVENLKKVDTFLREKFEQDERCINHVTTMSKKLEEPLPAIYYIPVENSFDVKKSSEKYLSESGTKSVQKVIEILSDNFPFLKEVYPIKWLKFKERIEVAAASTPVLTIQKLRDMATASKIQDEDQQNLAVKFLHDSGQIICLGKCNVFFYFTYNIYAISFSFLVCAEYVSNVFLSDQEKKELSDKVVIRPQWLISVMKVVMRLNLDEDNIGVDKSLVATFCKTGEAGIELLANCWKPYLANTEVVRLQHLCLLLKAYCLIFPLNRSKDKKSSETIQNEKSLFESDLEESALEIYHKFLCKHLMITPTSSRKNSFSQEECVIFTGEENWRIRYKEFKHVLEVSVVG